MTAGAVWGALILVGVGAWLRPRIDRLLDDVAEWAGDVRHAARMRRDPALRACDLCARPLLGGRLCDPCARRQAAADEGADYMTGWTYGQQEDDQ